MDAAASLQQVEGIKKNDIFPDSFEILLI